MTAAVTVRKNQFAEMAYVGDKPWHGLGQELQAGADLETWRVAAGMDRQVKRSRVRFDTDQIFDAHHVLFRSDTKAPLGIVSAKYKTVQPAEVLEFFRDLVADQGFELNTAGTLFGGSRFWALAKVGSATVIGNDTIRAFLLLATSCDGTLATTGKFVAERVVCNNTMTMALGESGKQAVIRHRSTFDPSQLKAKLGLASGSFAKFMTQARILAKKTITTAQAEAFVCSLLTESKTVLKEDVAKSKQFLKIMDLFKGSAMGGTLLGAEGTLWGVTNAVTEFVDHHAKTQTVDARLASAWFGRGDALKTEALERALALV